MRQRRVRPGMAYSLRELRDALATASSTVDNLRPGSAPEAFDAAADELFRVLSAARDLGGDESFTGCPLHPNGAIDPLAPPGWGRCLLCNDRRRRSTGFAPVGERAAGPEPRGDVRRMFTDTATGLQELHTAIRAINELMFPLGAESPASAFNEVIEIAYRAFYIARELSRPPSPTGCVIHPQGPVEHEPPRGWGVCLLCNTIRRRRAAAGPGWRDRLPTDKIRRPLLRPDSGPAGK